MASDGKDPSESHNYRIQVSDFGPIRRADVEFRPLTVFLGPTNAGKSYLATLSYALHRHFAANWDTYWHFFGKSAGPSDRKLDLTRDPEATTELESWFLAVTENRRPPRFSERVAEIVRLGIERADGAAKSLQEEIVRSFGGNGNNELIRWPGIGRAKIVVSPDGSTKRGALRYTARLAGDEVELEARVLGSPDSLDGRASLIRSANWPQLMEQNIPWHTPVGSDRPGVARRQARYARWLLEATVESVRQQLFAPLARMAYYLPADRTGIMHSHEMLVSALVRNAASASLRHPPNIPKLSGVLTDFLQELIRMGDRSSSGRVRGMRSGVASQLERNVLGGTVRVDSSESNYSQFLYRPQGWSRDLVLMRSASTVSELAPLVLYLRHVVHRGDVLIIEEPESHLHPAMQVEVIELLARVVSKGVRVIVTTHSEWVLDGLANIVQASRIDGWDNADGTGAPALPEHQVGAWRFIPSGSATGVVVEEVRIDRDGMYPTGFDEVAMRLHNRWAEIESQAGKSV